MVARRSIDQASADDRPVCNGALEENDKFYLKTPVEMIEIEVEDEPLFVNQVDQVEINGVTYLQLAQPRKT